MTLGNTIRSAIAPAYVRTRLLQERIQSGVSWYPLDSDYIADPYPTYRRLRERDPYHRSLLTGCNRQHGQEADGLPQAPQGRYPSDPCGIRSDTPASSNVAISVRHAAAESNRPIASTAPVPSPSLMPRSSKGLNPR